MSLYHILFKGLNDIFTLQYLFRNEDTTSYLLKTRFIIFDRLFVFVGLGVDQCNMS